MSFVSPNGSQTKLSEFGASAGGAPDPHQPLDLEPPPRRRWWRRRGLRNRQTESVSPPERKSE
jgi:hypothetical protein